MIKLLSQTFTKELTATPVNWLLANVGDKITITSTIKIETYAVSSTDNPFILNNTNGTIGVGWVNDPQGQFADFRVGDTLAVFSKVSGSQGTYTIVDKLDDSNIQLSAAVPAVGDNYLFDDGIISVTTAIKAIKYKWNFIENEASENFNSRVVGTEQLLVAPSKLASDTSSTAMQFIGEISYQEGSAAIVGALTTAASSTVPFSSNYVITHVTKITPYIIIDQIENETSNIYPDDFFNEKCWKFISEFQGAYDYTDPNYLISEVFTKVIGNTGWYGENFNTGKSNYYVDSVVYKDADSNIIPAIGLTTAETTVEIHIKNTVDSPFSNNNTKFVLGIFKVPSSESEYKQNSRALDTNFVYDRKLQTVGSAAANGDQYGVTGRQILKDVAGVYVSASEIKITCTIAMLAAVVSVFQESETPMYLMFVSTQNHTLDTDAADLVTLKIGFEEFNIVTTDPDMIVSSNVFIRHPEVDPETEGITPGTIGIPAVDPNPVIIQIIANAEDICLYDTKNNKTIGSVIWTTSNATTLTLLANSINTNTPGVTPFGGAPAFDNSFGYTATYDSGTDRLTIYAPLGSGAAYNTFTILETDRVTSGPIGIPSLIYNYVNEDYDGGVDGGTTTVTFDCYPEDEIVCCSKFYIDSNGREDDEIILQTIQGRIIAKNSSTGEVKELDGCTVNASSYPFIGYAQYMDTQVARAFHIPAGTIRKYIELKRRSDLDTGGKYYFTLNYPFLFRWEYWVKLLSAPASFFDASLPNNGMNEFWYRFSTFSNWDIKYQLNISATKNGTEQAYVFEQKITPHDYNSNAAFTTKNIKTYDSSGSPQLYDAGTGNNFIYGYANTLVKANFTKTSTPANVTVVIRLEVWEQGGIYGSRRYSSAWEADSDTWFKSTDGSNKIVLTPSGDSIEAKCLIDYTKLPANMVAFKLTSRIYEIAGVIETDDGVPILTDDGLNILID